MTSYEQGFLTKCAEHGVPNHVAGRLLKLAKGDDSDDEDDGSIDVMEMSTDSRLSRDERKELLRALPESRRKMIKSFLNKMDKDGLYTVRTNEYGSPTAMYDKILDRLYYTRAQQEERERRIRGKNLFWRQFLMGGVPMYTM